MAGAARGRSVLRAARRAIAHRPPHALPPRPPHRRAQRRGARTQPLTTRPAMTTACRRIVTRYVKNLALRAACGGVAVLTLASNAAAQARTPPSERFPAELDRYIANVLV